MTVKRPQGHKISLCLIARDNADVIGRCLMSVRDYVDEVIVVDTGSTDRTKKIVRSTCKGAVILDYNERTNPEGFLIDRQEEWPDLPLGPFTGRSMLADFASARQLGVDAASGDYIFWIDTDDVVDGAPLVVDIPGDLEQSGFVAAELKYDYSRAGSGESSVVDSQFFRERIVKKTAKPRWVGKVHEILTFEGPARKYGSPKIKHLHDSKYAQERGPKHRNLKILLKWHEDVEAGRAPMDARSLFYLGLEASRFMPKEAIKHLKKYTQIATSSEEQAVAHNTIGGLLELDSRFDEAEESFKRGQLAAPGNPDGFFGSARIAYFKKDLDACIAASEAGLEACRTRLPSSFTFQQNLMEQKWRPHVYYSFALLSKGRSREGLESAKAGLVFHPTQEHLVVNKKFAEKLLNHEVVDRPSSLEKQGRRELRRSGGKLSINIWTGPAWERWSPDSLETGIGGSETAAAQIAKSLVCRGHTVKVFGEAYGVWDGVEYVPHEKLSENPATYPCDVFVASRQPSALRFDVSSSVKALWVHDVHCGEGSEAATDVDRSDVVMALSTWHAGFLKQTYPNLDPEKIWVTSNGISLERFKDEPVKIGRRAIYASSPDRGLDRLLDLWPRIRERVPSAELHVYYGFETWKKIAASRNDTDTLTRLSVFERRLKKGRKIGVVYHGRVGQRELAKAYCQARVWAYPTAFTETSCISAMEAQAAGCVPVTTALAALAETVKCGYLIQGDPNEAFYADSFVERVTSCLLGEEEVSRRAREVALATFSWDDVAASWEEKLLELVAESDGSESKEEREPVIVRQSMSPRRRSKRKRKKIAVVLGKMGTSVHGLIDGRRPFDDECTFVTGTVGGFLGIGWGLAERGHDVDMICDAKEIARDSKELGGANVIPLDEAPPEGYDVCVAINEPDLLRQVPDGCVRIVAQWLNDFSYCQAGFDDFVDAYACPSMTLARKLSGFVGSDKMEVVPISINPELYDRGARRRPSSVAYASSPDRGLHVLLDLWPEIRRRVPAAELRVYYRVQPWLDTIVGTVPSGFDETWARAESIRSSLKVLGTNGENGLFMVGPLTPRRMLHELSTTEVLAYPCDPISFTEGYSLTVLDACAAGCVPICSDVDALGELWWGAAHLVRGKPSERKSEWVEAISRALTDQNFATEVRASAASRARELTRQRVAVMWEALIERIDEDKRG